MSVGPLLTLLAAVGLVIWLVRLVRTPRRTVQPGDIDLEELAAAEREVRDLDTNVRPDDDVPGADWGPGTPRPPTLL
ncbi:MAG: hypothetical protein KJZ47_14950 [Gemmatimonadales bacterium]|nr:hypothetical protein [Gemmatimonadales bacterium]